MCFGDLEHFWPGQKKMEGQVSSEVERTLELPGSLSVRSRKLNIGNNRVRACRLP